MTFDEIPSAGAELDALVNELVMGVENRCPKGCLCADIPPYSSDMDAAWLVVESLRKIGLSICLGDEDSSWEIEVITNEALYQQNYRGCYVTSPTAAEAICRAAVYAMPESLR